MKIHEVIARFANKKKRSAIGFSIRSLAYHLDLSPSFVSRVLSGKRALSYTLLERLREPLDIDNDTFQSLQKNYYKDIHKPVSVANRNFESPIENWELVGNTGFSVLRQWFYLPILEFTTLKNFDGKIEMIAKGLGLSQTATEVAVRELVYLGFLKEKNGTIAKSNKKIRWASAKSQTEIRRFHFQMMAKAQEELMQKVSDSDFEKRLITGITLTASPEKIAAAKKKLSDALHEIANDLIQDDGTEVYHLGAQFFPLTRPKA